MSPKHHTINYLELPLTNHAETKAFYESVFRWKFQDWGPDYLCFEEAGIDIGFSRELSTVSPANGVLVVLFSSNLEQTLSEVRGKGCAIVRDIFDFPGGRRFHFTDPNGNEIAVWGAVANA